MAQRVFVSLDFVFKRDFNFAAGISRSTKKWRLIMKKAGLFLIFAVVLVSFFTYGYGRDYGNSDIWTIPTFTPVPAAPLFVAASANYDSPSGIATYMVILTKGSVSGAAVSGASVTINGVLVPEISPGTGQYITMGPAANPAGTVVNMNITSSSGNATGSVTMPAAAGTSNGTVSGGAVGSAYTATLT